MPSGRLRFLAAVLVLLLQAAVAPVSGQEQPKSADFVNSLRGSDSSSRSARGNTFPAVAVPFGFNLWTPVTQPDSVSWLYAYEAEAVQGFAVSHQPNPAFGDYATFQIMPSVGKLFWRDTERAQKFRHAREVAKAHFYRVELDSGIRVELTPTLHAAAFRITFPAHGPRNLLFDAPDKAGGTLSADSAQGTVSGSVSFRGPKLYVFAKVDAPVDTVVSPPQAGPSVAISFKQSAPRTLTLRVGTSYLSLEQARAHVEQELAALSFDALLAQAQARWDDYFSRIQIEGATDSQKVTFYSNLYRALLYPSSMTEQVDGAPKHFSPYSNDVRPGALYVNTGFDAAYRAAWPLYILLAPQQAGVMLEGFVNAYREAGWVPRWSAPGYRDAGIGTHSDAVFADAYLKGVRNFDVNTAYASMLKNALVVPTRASLGRGGMARGVFRNYSPLEASAGSAAWHLESCVDDFSTAQLAHALGDETHAQYLRLRSLSYPALRSPELGLAAANHDPGGMISLYGGPQPFAVKLDALLGASPDVPLSSYKHLLYMFNDAGQPWQTQRYVRKLLSEPCYGPGAAGGGYLGDESNAQMSAWYVFSALGLYPASPGHARYAIGSPLFERVKLALENGKTFEVLAHDNNASHVYIQRATLNGQALVVPYLSHAQIVNGGVLELFMGESASTWGSAALTQPEHADTQALADGLLTDCAQGGVASASSDNPDAGEEAKAAFDDDSRTKWLASTSSAWLRYQTQAPCTVRFYTLTSADDEPARDPKEWLLEGSQDGKHWLALDERHNQQFGFRHQTRVFQLPQPAAYRSYRLRITANYGDPELQLAELELLSIRGQDVAPSVAEPAEPRGQCGCGVVASGAGGRSYGLLLLLIAAIGRAASRPVRSRAGRRPAARGGRPPAEAP